MIIRTIYMSNGRIAKVKGNIVYINKRSLSSRDTQFIIQFLDSYSELSNEQLIKSYKYMLEYEDAIFYNLSGNARKLIALCFKIEMKRRKLILGDKVCHNV